MNSRTRMFLLLGGGLYLFQMWGFVNENGFATLGIAAYLMLLGPGAGLALFILWWMPRRPVEMGSIGGDPASAFERRFALKSTQNTARDSRAGGGWETSDADTDTRTDTATPGRPAAQSPTDPDDALYLAAITAVATYLRDRADGRDSSSPFGQAVLAETMDRGLMIPDMTREQVLALPSVRAIALTRTTSPVPLADLPGPDLYLWHSIVTDRNAFDEWRQTIWWILEQPACDRATVAEFLCKFVMLDLADALASEHGADTAARFAATVARWRAGYYRDQSLGLSGNACQPRASAADLGAVIASMRRATGFDLPDLPNDIFDPMHPALAGMVRHQPSGMIFDPETATLQRRVS